MKNKISNKKILIFTIAIFLLSNSLISVGISKEVKSIKENIIEKTDSKNSILKVDYQSKTVTKSCKATSSGMIQNLDLGFSEGESNIIITDSSKNESYPSMVFKRDNGIVFYEVEDEDGPFIYLKTTTNYGQSWNGEHRIIADVGSSSDVPIASPNIHVHPESINKHLYGTFKSSYNNSGAFGYFESYDFNNIPNGNFDIYTFDWSYFYNETIEGYFSFWGFDSPNIIHYKNNTTPWVISIIGSTNYTNLSSGEGPAEDSIMFCFNDLENPDNFITIAWFPEIQNCSNLSIANDFGNEYIYGITEVKENGDSNLLFFRGNPYDWYYGDVLFNKTLEISGEDLFHPSIYTEDDKVYITAETNESGIVLFKSEDNGNAWTSESITDDLLDVNATPAFSNIIGNETHLLCSFIESGNLSITSSGDNGTSWETPEMINNINGSVVEDYKFVDFPDEYHIVWTDQRNDNYDLFATVRGFPKIDISIDSDSVNLTSEGIKIIPTKNKLLYKIVNNGGFPVSNIQINISVEFDEELNKSALAIGFPLNIDYLDAGDEIDLQKFLFRIDIVEFIRSLLRFAGIKYVNISIILKPHYVDENPDNNNFRLPVNYAYIFPNLGFLEDIFLIT